MNENGRRESANPDDSIHSALWWRQAGKRVKDATMVLGRRRRKNKERRTAEDEQEREREKALIMFR